MDCFSTSLEGLAVKEGKILKATLTDILQSLLTQSTPVWFTAQVYFSCAAIPVVCFSMSLGGLASKEGRILQEYLLDIHQSILTHLSPVFSCPANHVSHTRYAGTAVPNI